ncbi:hypothetical protein PGT21_013124 [Puccinia graminis f. sp. tritici]|uniref:Uncharacterized protein n=1 Tax=Puccinia graminis f. sp. tritici TaxID=56615 RepID=A0A5B0NFB8_PUCGR|nr:hypothetical protein PGT21_013124 [Puccinia graminis f. sp. tritici]KAA1088045.1 hypothetical protein PGTUg99_023150 [Puccinia graminis f. sp. tritici]
MVQQLNQQPNHPRHPLDSVPVDRPPRVDPIGVDYLLVIPNWTAPKNPAAHLDPKLWAWSKLSLYEKPIWEVNLSAMDWKEFQHEALKWISDPCAFMLKYLEEANANHMIAWHASIEGHDKYDPKEKFQLMGILDYIEFSASAYDMYPCKASINILMDDPFIWSLNGSLSTALAKLISMSKRTIALPPGHKTPSVRKASSSISSIKAPPSKRLDNTITKPKQPMARGENKENKEIEVINLDPPPSVSASQKCPIISVSHSKKATTSTKKTRAPLPPLPPHMEAITLETYLLVALIPTEDNLTCAQMKLNGINHWSYFQSSSEEELTHLGFPLGIARSLCEVVGRLDVHLANLNLKP